MTYPLLFFLTGVAAAGGLDVTLVAIVGLVLRELSRVAPLMARSVTTIATNE